MPAARVTKPLSTAMLYINALPAFFLGGGGAGARGRVSEHRQDRLIFCYRKITYKLDFLFSMSHETAAVSLCPAITF